MEPWDSAAADPNVATVVHPNGTVVGHGVPRSVTREGDYTSASDLGAAYELLLLSNPVLAAELDSIWEGLKAAASSMGDVTVAIGLDFDIALYLGYTAGVGVYASTTGDYGVYTSLGGDWGIVGQIALGVGVMIIRGGPDRLAGPCLAVEISGDIGIGGSAALMFSPIDFSYMGVCAEVSVGIGGGLFLSLTDTQLHWQHHV